MSERIIPLNELKAMAERTVDVRKVLDGDVVTHELMDRNIAEMLLSVPVAHNVRRAKIQPLEDYLKETT